MTKCIFKKNLTVQDDFNPVPGVWVKDFDLDSSIVFAQSIAMLEQDESVKEIFVYVSSYGGETMALLSMIETMQLCSKPVHTVVTGFAASCGAIFAICAPGKRFIGNLSSLLLHHVRTGIEEDLPGIEQAVKAMSQIDNKLLKLAAKRSSVTLTSLKNKLKEENREWTCSAQEAVEWGLMDHIGLPKISSSVVVEYSL